MAKAKKIPKSQLLQEPAVAYQTRSSLQVAGGATLTYWLGGKASVKQEPRSAFDIISIGTAGLPKSSVDELARYLGISRKSMAEDVLDLSVKTLERKSPTEKLDKRTSFHALEIAKLMQHGFAVFEDEEKLQRWMKKENRSLNGMRPIDLLDSLTGLTMVNDVLGRIEEGVYS